MAAETLSRRRGQTYQLPGLRAVMEERGLSGHQVGLLSDVHYATISRVLRGSNANWETTTRLARGLKVKPKELLTEGGAVPVAEPEPPSRKSCPLPNLHRTRKAEGLTMRGLAALSDVHPTTISHIENGARPATPETTTRLARALTVKPEALMAEPPEASEALMAELGDEDEGSIEDRYVHRFTMGGEEHDPMFEAELVGKKLAEFREASGTDEAFREIATELLMLGKARGKELAQ